MNFLRSKLQWVFLGFSGAGLLLAIVSLSGPAWVYAGNADEFAASPAQIFSVYLPYVLAALGAVLVLLILLPAAIARPIALVLAMLGGAAWVQGTFLLNDFGSLNGNSWIVAIPIWRAVLEVALLLAAAVAVWLLGARAPAVIATLVLLLAVAAVAEPMVKLPRKADLREVASDSPLFHFSPEKNLLIVLLDGMQSEIFDEVTQENPDIRAALDGFTYYPDTAGVGYSTILTIPVLHSGREYEGGQPIKEFYAETVTTHSFLSELTGAGYDTAVINPLYGVCPSRIGLCSQAKPILTTAQTTVATEANKLLSIGLFRASPFFLKKVVYNRGKWRRLVVSEDPRTAHFSVEGNTFMEEVGARAATTSSKPTAKFLHLFSTHLPVAVDESCGYVGDLKSTREGFKQQAKCALAALARMVGRLKQRGIYDRTAIILLSDHGSGGWRSSRGIVTDLVKSYLTAVANPTLAVKPIEASGAMRRDDKPMSLADVPGLACKLVSDCSKALANEERRVRRYRHYRFDASAWAKNDPIDIKTFSISGPVFDGRNWSKPE